MKKQKNNLNHYKVYIGISLAVFVLFSGWEFYQKAHTNIHSQNKVTKEFHLMPLVYTKEAKVRGDELVATTPPKSIKKESIKFFRDMMNNKVFSTFFYVTLDFFGKGPEAYPAARFVALTLLMESSPRMFQLMSWTKSELVKYSQPLMTTIQQKSNQIDQNPYFHNRMLNLAYQLDVPNQDKANLYSKSIDQPISVLSNGGLSNNSLSLEIALILAKQSHISSDDLTSSVARAIAQNESDLKAKDALKVRVLAYYPDQILNPGKLF